jgi:hypothetical protein
MEHREPTLHLHEKNADVGMGPLGTAPNARRGFGTNRQSFHQAVLCSTPHTEAEAERDGSLSPPDHGLARLMAAPRGLMVQRPASCCRGGYGTSSYREAGTPPKGAKTPERRLRKEHWIKRTSSGSRNCAKRRRFWRNGMGLTVGGWPQATQADRSV